MKTWPMDKKLSFYFTEYRVIRATRIALFSCPLVAILAAASQLWLNGLNVLPQAITLACFFISLPLQGLYWLGWRSQHPLPLTLFDWGNKLAEQLSSAGVYCRPLGAKACYGDMAQILKLAFEKLEASFWDEL